MFVALWIEPGLPLLYRHVCDGLCEHGLGQTDRWTTLSGVEVERDPLSTPQRGLVLTRYSSGERYFSNQSAGLAFKVVLSGEEIYEIEGGIHHLHSGEALLINPERDYASLIPGEVSQTFCLSFGSLLVAEARWASSATPDEALEGPGEELSVPLVLERVHRSNPQEDAALLRLLGAVRDLERDLIEELALSFLGQVLETSLSDWQQAERLDILNKSLREETLQRIYRARDFMEYSWNQKATLDDWSGVACMSRFHFLRLFRAVFDETPRQYFIRRRLERADMLLAEGDTTVTQIALECGFESLSHFSNAFRRHFGVSPQARREN